MKLVLCFALVGAETVNAAAITRKAAPPTPTAPAAPPIDQKAIDAAKKVIAMFGGRTDYDFTDAQTETDFENLIRAEKDAITIDDPTTFILWWKINQKTVLAQTTGPGKKPNWEALCLLSYIAYINQMVAVSKDATKFKEWQARAAGSSYAEKISPYAFGLITVLGGILFSPTMAFVNGWLKDGLGISLFQVGKDIVGYYGVRPIRNKANAWSARFFKNRFAKLRADIDAKSAKVAEAIKPFERSNRANLSPAEAKESFKVLIEAFTQLSIAWARMPEWARKNRDNFVDMLTTHSDTVAHYVGSSVNAAQTQRNGANNELILMGQRNPTEAAAIQDLGEQLHELVLKRMRLGELSPEQYNIYRGNVTTLRERFVKLGATKESFNRLYGNIQAEYTFTREAASWLAAQMFHSANAYDLSDTMDASYSKFMDSNSNNFFRKSLGDTVELILEEIRQSLGETTPTSGTTVRTIDDSFTSNTLEALDNTPANESLLEFSEGQTAKRSRKATIKADVEGALKLGVRR